MLTLNKIKNLKDSLQSIIILCDDILRNKEYRQLFLSEEDLRNSKIMRLKSPDDYYSFRDFDTQIKLHYNRQIKCYYINIEHSPYNILFRKKEFYDTFDSFFDNELKICIKDTGTNLVLNKEYNFDYCVEIFNRLCLYYLSKKIITDKLFEIY